VHIHEHVVFTCVQVCINYVSYRTKIFKFAVYNTGFHDNPILSSSTVFFVCVRVPKLSFYYHFSFKTVRFHSKN
jgi:hypothetical protein